MSFKDYATETVLGPKLDPKLVKGWKRNPSVWTGGKPWFYTRPTTTGREWISWDRAERAWVRRVEDWTKRELEIPCKDTP